MWFQAPTLTISGWRGSGDIGCWKGGGRREYNGEDVSEKPWRVECWELWGEVSLDASLRVLYRKAGPGLAGEGWGQGSKGVPGYVVYSGEGVL